MAIIVSADEIKKTLPGYTCSLFSKTTTASHTCYNKG